MTAFPKIAYTRSKALLVACREIKEFRCQSF